MSTFREEKEKINQPTINLKIDTWISLQLIRDIL